MINFTECCHNMRGMYVAGEYMDLAVAFEHVSLATQFRLRLPRIERTSN